jgi:hypothetical protein
MTTFPDFVNSPIPIDTERMQYLGLEYTEYKDGSCGWFSELFDPLLFEATMFGFDGKIVR